MKTEKPEFRRGRAIADWLPEGRSVECIHAGRTWNGWLCPFFDMASAMELMGLMPALSFDKDRLAVFFEDEFVEHDEWPAMEIEIDGKIETVWPIGSGSWCWMLDDEEGA